MQRARPPLADCAVGRGVPADPAPRSVCPRCRRPESVCYCHHLVPVDSRTRVVLLQHPREREKAIGTAHMASLCLTNSELHVGVDWSQSSALVRALSDPARPAMLLYPGEGALDVLAHPPSSPITLIVVDGTWSNTKKMVRCNPVLARLPRLAFEPPAPSQYRIRREPNAACVSTIEALAYVLGALEGDPERFRALLSPFFAMVDTQVNYRDLVREGRGRKKRGRSPGRDPVPSRLRDKSASVVCVAGEANAWPYGSEQREQPGHEEELVHWVACRIATGEVFDGLAVPRGPLSPSTPSHIGLAAQAIEGAGSLGRLLENWRAFIREGDTVCSWGRYATSLFVRSGGYLPPARVDLRRVARDVMKRPIGTMDAFGEAVGVGLTERLASGRAGLRLGQLVRLARHLAEPAGALVTR